MAAPSPNPPIGFIGSARTAPSRSSARPQGWTWPATTWAWRSSTLTTMAGLGVVCADFNGDGWPDIFVANDGQANHLWINRRDGTFAEEATQRGLAFNEMGDAESNRGVALGDVDGDGLFDLFITHLTEEN